MSFFPGALSFCEEQNVGRRANIWEEPPQSQKEKKNQGQQDSFKNVTQLSKRVWQFVTHSS